MPPRSRLREIGRTALGRVPGPARARVLGVVGRLQTIPKHLYEAAKIDGASAWDRFWTITLPQLRNTATTSSVLMIVGSLTYFETVLILTQGGPGTDTAILPYLMYEAGFKSYDFGYASAVSAT